jgi:hypothetical protein
MNQGKRHIRNTVITVCGLTVLTVVAARLYASTVDADTPPWVRKLMTLGLAATERATITSAASPATKSARILTLSDLRDFTGINVEGSFAVEITGAPQYKVSLDGVATEKWTLDWDRAEGGVARIKGGAGTEGSVLHIETPALTSIEAKGLKQLTVRGVKGPELTLRLKDVAGVRLEGNSVGSWILHSDTPVEVQAERIAPAAGYTIRATGYVTIHGPGKTKTIVRGGGSSLLIYRNNK